MSTVVIEHVKVSELPKAWRKQVQAAADAMVTVRIEAEETRIDVSPQQPNAAFGMWADRSDLKDVAGHVRAMRAGRYGSS